MESGGRRRLAVVQVQQGHGELATRRRRLKQALRSIASRTRCRWDLPEYLGRHARQSIIKRPAAVRMEKASIVVRTPPRCRRPNRVIGDVLFETSTPARSEGGPVEPTRSRSCRTGRPSPGPGRSSRRSPARGEPGVRHGDPGKKTMNVVCSHQDTAAGLAEPARFKPWSAACRIQYPLTAYMARPATQVAGASVRVVGRGLAGWGMRGSTRATTPTRPMATVAGRTGTVKPPGRPQGSNQRVTFVPRNLSKAMPHRCDGAPRRPAPGGRMCEGGWWDGSARG